MGAQLDVLFGAKNWFAYPNRNPSEIGVYRLPKDFHVDATGVIRYRGDSATTAATPYASSSGCATTTPSVRPTAAR